MCGDTFLPKASDCKVSQSQSKLAEPIGEPAKINAPIGTILLYFGSKEDLPSGWVLCHGQTAPYDSKLKFDANIEMHGTQVPDLRGRFVRGATVSNLSDEKITYGGSDTIDLQHVHTWARYEDKIWHSFDDKGKEFALYLRKDRDGSNMPSSGYYPLLVPDGKKTIFYTSSAGDENILPRYAEVHYIIRVF